jgi:riboflavin synthase
MFTGIIQALGTVAGLDSSPRAHGTGALAHRLEIDLGPLADGLELGASVAINGVCLTLAERRGHAGCFDAVPETWNRTTLRDLHRGDLTHLERSLRVGDPLDGHFVQGHVDGTGTIERIERAEGEWKLWIAAEPALMPFVAPKGAIAIDGTSLTLVDVTENRFSIALVPTTLARTTFARRKPGDRVNIETDILARLVMRSLQQAGVLATGGAPPTGLTWDHLRAGGYVT